MLICKTWLWHAAVPLTPSEKCPLRAYVLQADGSDAVRSNVRYRHAAEKMQVASLRR